MNTPHFSVLIPTFRRPRLLRRALASVLAQHGPDFEILVGDDGGGEGLEVVASLADPRVRGFLSGRAGQVPTRNMLLERARAPRIAWLDDDDWWAAETHLAACAAALDRNGGLVCAGGWIVHEDEDGTESSRLPFEVRTDPRTLRTSHRMLASGIAYSRTLHRITGQFDRSLPFYHDWDWYLRVSAAGIPLTAAGGDHVRISARPGSVSSAAHEAARRAELDRLCAKHGLASLPLRNHASIAHDDASLNEVVASALARLEPSA